MACWSRAMGVVIGLSVGGAILALSGGLQTRPAPSGSMLSECDGRMRELVVHYEPTSRSVVSVVYQQFLDALDPDVTVHVVCPNGDAFEEFVTLVGEVQCHLNPIFVMHPITAWSRDRWVALAPGSSSEGVITVLSPRGEAGSELWPARAGDERVGDDLASKLAPAIRAHRSGLLFDGGDFLADSRCVFVVPRVLQRNIQHTVASREEFLRVAAAELKRPIILLDNSPDHHAAMFMCSAGNNIVLVGDPQLGRALTPALPDLPGGPDFTPATQRLFDAVAEHCAAAGYEVQRIPTVPAVDGRTYLTYVNVLIDEQAGQRIVYMPVYAGVEALNEAAYRVWERLGFEVRPVDCTATYRHFGCLHCLVNVLSRF